ncbi:MAG: diversity-generating retroelement protein bAvd family protein [Flammeovirgaceae bacterium]|nr:diversity-generating retroelement protein bAvd family protein [Flammeovirgaceae bacterium]|tara:strand:- start:2798 stop:3169 length:372 start_codon:yes stop_codon:yes gene_type:complete
MGSFRDLTVFKKAFSLAMDVFEITKEFPSEEKYALTDQLRRSSRSVCRAIGEGYRKRQYPKHFSSKMSDADMENSETQISLDFAVACNYISEEKHNDLIGKSEEVGRMLNHMIENPEKYKPRK